MRHIIWSNEINLEEWAYDYQEWLADSGYTEGDAPLSLEEWAYDCNSNYLGDEKMNLDKELDGVVVLIGTLGLWDGKHLAFRIFGNNLNNVLSGSCGDYTTWYCDRYNVCCEDIHHDGTNFYEYRLFPSKESAERAIDLVMNMHYGESIGEKVSRLKKKSKSLRPYVKKVYGW